MKFLAEPTDEVVTKGKIAMALWRKDMQIPQIERERKKKARRKKREIPLNSFYIFGTGKTPNDYVESPENRRLADINQQDD